MRIPVVLVSLLGLLALVTGRHVLDFESEMKHKQGMVMHMAMDECQRSKVQRNVALPGDDAELAVEDRSWAVVKRQFVKGAAFIEDMCLEHDSVNNGGCIKKKTYGWGMIDDEPFVWVKSSCKANFLIQFAVAYHSHIIVDSLVHHKHFTAVEPPHPCKGDTKIFSMKLEKEFDRDNNCGNFDARHVGLGNNFGCFNRTVWADRGCFAKFKVCEVSIYHFLDQHINTVADHKEDHDRMKKHMNHGMHQANKILDMEDAMHKPMAEKTMADMVPKPPMKMPDMPNKMPMGGHGNHH